MGATYAPLIAAGRKVAGVIVWGGGATTWFERMLAFERHALELGGTDPARLSAEMNARANYFERYLLQGESPETIARVDPELGEVWSRFGRHQRQSALRPTVGLSPAGTAPELAGGVGAGRGPGARDVRRI